ncbi:MAG TPA: hypothetical protein VD908_20300 [Cytophagales bacterium]|nr:hypothetical protein [Cytophagales bacterium]
MEKSLFTSLIIVFCCLTFSLQAQKITLQPAWESDTTLRTPESVLFEPKENVLYVSCINGGPSGENNNSFIAKVDQDGKVIKLKFAENLNSTKGMGILGNKLYVTEMTNVAEIDLATGKVLNRYSVEGAKFLNDIDVDTKNNIVYITDSGTSRLLSLKDGKITTILDSTSLKGPNGLLFENNQLLIGNGDGSLLTMNPATKKVKTVASGMGGLDGIVALGGKKYIVSEWKGKIWYIPSDGKPQLMIDSEKEKINTADLGYNPKTKVLFVPTFFHNTVKAYSVK